MAQTLDFNLPVNVYGGKLLSFTYSRTLNNIMGSWSAEIQGGTFTSGQQFSINGMTGGYISFAMKDEIGVWRLSGYDAGICLMKTTPYNGELATGGAGAVIQDLASYCGIDVSVGGGLGGFDIRSVVSGTTCAEAILELCMLSGYIAYINNAGDLVCTVPSSTLPDLDVIFDDGTQLDLENYATHVTTIVTRRKLTIAEEVEQEEEEDPEDPGGGPTWYYKGSTPSDDLEDETSSGSYSYTEQDNTQVSCSWSITTIMPLGVIKQSTRTMTRGTIIVSFQELHEYDVQSKTVWRGSREYRLFAYTEIAYTTTKTTTGTYEGANGTTNFEEITTETMERTFDIFDAIFVNPDWKGDLDMVAKEEYKRMTIREGGEDLQEGMTPYAPDYDSIVTKEYKRMNFGRGVLCMETESRFELRDVGRISGVDIDGVPAKYLTVYPIGLPSHISPEWVEILTYRTTYEGYKKNGEPEIATSSQWSDNGSKWLFDRGYVETGDASLDVYQESYAKFTQMTESMDVSLGSGSSTSVWNYLELPGRQKVKTESQSQSSDVPINSEDWYQDGGYAVSKYCPHYEEEDKTCAINGINAIGDFEGSSCPYLGRGWQSCVRARAALEEARQNEDRPLIEAPIVGSASTSGGVACSYQREFYIDNIITNPAAQSIANTAAQNILNVKGTKGLRRTIVIPLDISLVPNGTITSVSHDWKSMKTTVSFRISGTVPSFMVPSSAAGVADGISGRNAGRSTRPRVGTITAINSAGDVFVSVGSVTYVCSTRLVNLGVGDSVLITMVSGNSMRGHITNRI
jgi:hypothetical protein